MLTRSEIAAEATELDELERDMWETLIRQHPAYKSTLYPDLTATLADTTGVKAQQLLAALRKVEAIGSDTTRINGGPDALEFDPVRNLEALVLYGLMTLYDRASGQGIVLVLIGQE